jgi:predicted enzyme related to lactoylglutathione lyase
MARVTGIGGVFFKSSKDHKALAEWYKKVLGMPLEPWGLAVLRWSEDPTADKGATAWQVREKDSESFAPSRSSFMINYRIDDMDGMLAQLKKNKVPVVPGSLESDEFGRFACVMDPDGNKVALWEPQVSDGKKKKK